ncbi:autophagy-related protein 13b [Diospyros lotus]|uniref:autophagy-related protein 13b n=1 Tax=Diospyros lotus TaxID=55363 RepID=UPI00225A290D|nr:autophagy-related protein 13b [Diospyros lotus]XP_052195400.1 autophagy-related protein 13b [Diospyros lotus]
MASFHGNMQPEPAKMEQIITEFFAKSLHIILESRCPYVSSRNYSGEQMISSPSSSSSSSSSIRPRDKWFNLALTDCSAALENIDLWRQSNLEPVVIDVILVQRPTDLEPLNCSPRRGLVRNFSAKEQSLNFWNSEHDNFGCPAKTEKILERWVVQYESRKTGRSTTSGSKRSSGSSWQTSYKKSILLLRSLYAMVRLLPAYKLFRDLNSSGKLLTFNLAHRVSSFVEPFTRREESEMQQFVFTPVDTFCGRLCLSVLYHSSLMDVSSEPSTPMSPQFIQDYVGSPMADPLKRFPSLPVPQGSPSSFPFGRRHSWSYDLYRASPPSALPSPSPTYSDSRASITKPSSDRLPSRCSPHPFPETPLIHKSTANFDEYWPSIFSPSPSSSPPTYGPESNKYKTILRSESAPVSIPASKLAIDHSSIKKQYLPPSPPLKTTRYGASKIERNSGLIHTNSTVDKLCSFVKEGGRHSGMKISSNSSPQKSFSRSSSRLSFQDDFDDSEFSGPFIVDDDEAAYPGSRPRSFDQKEHPCEPLEPGGMFPIRKSQDAAVGALIHMLKKAPPLSQNISGSVNFSGAKLSGAASSSCTGEPEVEPGSSASMAESVRVGPKTIADALEELQSYRGMKASLLKQGRH